MTLKRSLLWLAFGSLGWGVLIMLLSNLIDSMFASYSTACAPHLHMALYFSIPLYILFSLSLVWRSVRTLERKDVRGLCYLLIAIACILVLFGGIFGIAALDFASGFVFNVCGGKNDL